jgi:hypothetical protein
MSCASFLSGNLVTAPGTTLSASSEDALFYPVTNIQSAFTTKVWRSAEGVNAANVVFDFKTIDAVDYLAVTPSSIDGAGFSGLVTFEANQTSNFTSPAFTTTLEFNNDFQLGLKKLSADESYRFWRVSVSGTGNYVELSKIYIGKSTTLASNNIDFGWTIENRDTSRLKLNRYRQKFIDIIGNQTFLRANYKLLNIAEFETIMTVFDANGISKPLWFVVDESETIISDQERFAGYFQFRRRPRVRNSSFGLYDLSVELEQAL